MTTDTAPHLSDEYAPLDALIRRALRRYGDFHPSTLDPEVTLMFIEFANETIDDIHAHPYHNVDEVIPYYQSANERREIEDSILVQSFLYRYAFQQGSNKLQVYAPFYFRHLNQRLWHKLNGNTAIRLKVVDGGTNPSYQRGTTNPYNGLVTEDGDSS